MSERDMDDAAQKVAARLARHVDELIIADLTVPGGWPMTHWDLPRDWYRECPCGCNAKRRANDG